MGSAHSGNTVTQTGGNFTVLANGSSMYVGGGMALVTGQDNTVTQTGVQFVLEEATSTGAAIGIVLTLGSVRLALFSGSALGHHICGGNRYGEEQVTGFVDIAGYDAENPENCGDGVAYRNTTNPDHWRQAHGEKCSERTSNGTCHYPHEELLAAVNGEQNGTAWLISRQRYPFKNMSNPAGLVRISQLNLIGMDVRENKSFGINSTRLLSPDTNQPSLPEGQAAAARAIGQSELAAIYPIMGDRAVLLARFSLGGEEGHYSVDKVAGVVGEPVLLNSDSTRESFSFLTWDDSDSSQTVHHYVWNTRNRLVATEYDLSGLSNYTNDPVIGLGYENQWLYVARHSSEDIVLERIDLLDCQLDREGAVMKNVSPEVTGQGFNFTIRHFSTGRVVMIPRHTVLAEGRGCVKGLLVEWSEYGGESSWTVSDGQVFDVKIRPKKPTTVNPEITTVPPSAADPTKSTIPPNAGPTKTTVPFNTYAVPVCLICGAVAGSLGTGGCIYCKNKISSRYKRYKNKKKGQVAVSQPQSHDIPVEASTGAETGHMPYEYETVTLPRNQHANSVPRNSLPQSYERPVSLRDHYEMDPNNFSSTPQAEAGRRPHEYENVTLPRDQQANSVPRNSLPQSYERPVSLRDHYEMDPNNFSSIPHVEAGRRPHEYETVTLPRDQNANSVPRNSLPQSYERPISLRDHYEMDPNNFSSTPQAEAGPRSHEYETVTLPRDQNANSVPRNSLPQSYERPVSLRDHYEMDPNNSLQHHRQGRLKTL